MDIKTKYTKSYFRAYSFLLLGLIVTFASAYYLENKTYSDEFALFNLRNERIVSKIKERFNIQSVFINNTVAFLEASNKKIDEKSFKKFFTDNQYQFYSLGIFSIGLNTYVPRAELQTFEKKMQLEGNPKFKVFPVEDREFYTPVTFLEPENPYNLRAIGYDTYSNPIRKQAQDLALETGKTIITKKIILVQSNGEKAKNAVLIFSPIFKSGLPKKTSQDRKKALFGFISSPVQMIDLFKEVLKDEDLQTDQSFTFTLYDSKNPTTREVLFSTHDVNPPYNSRFQQTKEIDFDAFNQWSIEFFSKEKSQWINLRFAKETIVAAISGTSLSIIIFLFMLSSIKLRRKSREIRTLLTQENSTLNQRLQLALASANMGVWDYDPINNILLWDDKQFEIFGIDKKSFEGLYSAWVNTIHPDDRDRASQESQDAVLNKHDFNSEFRIIKNGEIRYIKGQAIVVKDASDNVTRMIGVNFDVTDQHETLSSLETEKQRAEIANQAKSSFIARMSHEIRTPLNGIIGLSSLALRHELSKEIRNYFDQIRFSSNSLLKILNEILDYAKLERGKMTIEEVPFELSSLIEESKNLFTPSATLKNNILTFEIDSKIPNQLIGDELHLRQILFNLIGNAVKFTTNGSILIHIQLVRFFEDRAEIAFF
jgi:PAS domain S-box-containing protein